MNNGRITARDIMETIFSEASGRPRAEVAAILHSMPPGRLDREYAPEEAEELLAKLRRELPQIRAWLLDGARRFEARLATAGIAPIRHN